MRNIVIYIIKNIENNKFYLGSSSEFKKRKYRHIADLRKGIHHSLYLQRSYDKYGESKFVFEILIETQVKDEQEQFALEQKYLNELDFAKCYNVSKVAGGGDMISYHPDKENIIKRMVASMHELREQGKIKIPDTKGEKNSNWRGGGKKCKCGEKIANAANCCTKCRDRSNENNPFYGKHHSEESKEKIRQKNSGKYNGNQEKIVLIDNVEYKSLAEAGRILNIHLTTIRYRILSPNPLYNGYKYK